MPQEIILLTCYMYMYLRLEIIDPPPSNESKMCRYFVL